MFASVVVVDRDEAEFVAGGGDGDWKRLMGLRSVRAAQQLAKQIAERVKPGFSGGDSLPQNVGWKSFQSAKEGVGALMDEEVSLRLGKLVLRKDRALADALAKDKNEAAFLRCRRPCAG